MGMRRRLDKFGKWQMGMYRNGDGSVGQQAAGVVVWARPPQHPEQLRVGSTAVLQEVEDLIAVGIVQVLAFFIYFTESAAAAAQRPQATGRSPALINQHGLSLWDLLPAYC